MALQRAVGNRAVAGMLARRHEHEARDGHPVQRSSVPDVLKSPGRPLDSATRADVEARLGADFSDVRLHTDAAARGSAQEIGARAYTSGNHVVVGPGGGDRHTLLHELVHVVQQRSGPVAGTDNGAGLRVSDPSDRFEREAEQTATRVMSRPSGEAAPAQAATGSPASGAGQPVQRMEGFEAEVDKRVRDPDGSKIPGDAPIGTSTAADFHVVADSRTLDNGQGYSNVEFVSGAVQVVGSNAEEGKQQLSRIVDEMKNVRDKFYAAVDGTKLEDLELNLRLERAGVELTGEGYQETAGTPGMGDGLFVHYSVGVPLSGMPSFFDHLRGDTTPRTHPTLQRAGHRLQQARTFAEAEVARFEAEQEGAGVPGGTDALNGYLQLYYTQVAASADYLHFHLLHERDRKTDPAQAEQWAWRMGQIKNHTIVLARSPLGPMVRTLDPAIRRYLQDNADDVVTRLSTLQQQALPGEGDFSFPDEQDRTVGDLPSLRLLPYALAGLTGSDDYSQQRIFGGMNEIPPHEVEGATVVPMEIRTFGNGSKTWDELRAEVLRIADWAQEAYQHDRAIERPRAGKRRRRR